MTATIISSVISAVVSIIVCLINANKQMAIMQIKLEELTKQVEKHNKVVDRTYNLETRVAVLESEVN